jgi:hypothetical protein
MYNIYRKRKKKKNYRFWHALNCGTPPTVHVRLDRLASELYNLFLFSPILYNYTDDGSVHLV